MNFILHSDKKCKLEIENYILKLFFDYFIDFDQNFIFYHFVDYNSKKLSLNDLKTFINKTYVSNVTGSKKIFVLHRFNDFSDLMQNYLLKILEESSDHFVLICENISKVIPTIISRCIYFFDKNNFNQFDDNSQGFVLHIISFFNDVINNRKIDRELIISELKQIINNYYVNQEISIIVDYLIDSIKKIEANCNINSIAYDVLRFLKSNLKHKI